jgi:CO dehydrogenase nickel-insertion accessory protein CooC1
MKIAVISPDRKQGISTVSALLGLALAQTQNFSVCLTYTGNKNATLPAFLGIQPTEDKTRNLTQVIKLLESNAITGEEIQDYCLKVPGTTNLQLMDTASETISDADNSKLVRFVIENMNHDVVITDVATEIYEEITHAVIDNSDLIVMVLTQSREAGEKLKYWESAGILSHLNQKGLVYIFNQYDPNVEAFRDTTKRMGLRHRRCAKITYNSFIKRTSNIGKLQTILPYILARDPRVIELNNDIKECLLVILANLGRRMNWPKT